MAGRHSPDSAAEGFGGHFAGPNFRLAGGPRDLRLADAARHDHCGIMALRLRRKTNFWILPVAVFGNSLTM
jgi:hypothetical protein